MMIYRNFVALILAVLLLGGTAAAGADAPKDAAAPKAVFPATTLTFANVVEGVVVTRDFTVKNFGSTDLRIDKIKTG